VLPGRGALAEGRSQRISHEVELGGGGNRIEVSAFAANGLESLRAYRDVQRTDAPPRDLYFLGLGVSRYRESSMDLALAAKDAKDLAELFPRIATPYRNVHVMTLLDEEVTTDRIRAAKDFLRRSSVGDTVVVFLAGHGTYTDDAVGEYVFVNHATDPSRLRETATPFAVIEDLVSDIPARKRLLLLDTCESGDRDERVAAPPTSASGARSRGVRALVRVKQETRAAVPHAVVRDRERFIYNDLARRAGAVVFSSSRGNEVSYESERWGNGAFTADLKVALGGAADADRDGEITTEELRRYVTDAVARRTSDLQHPTIDRDNSAARFGIAIAKP
jgi:hypothetical protein